MISKRIRAARRDDRGYVLLPVIGMALVFLIIMMTISSSAVGTESNTGSSVLAVQATAAAEAGVADYIQRLDADNSYIGYGNPSDSFSVASSLSSPPQTNPAFGSGTTGTWAAVPGSTYGAAFRYAVDTSQYAQWGTVRLESTGRAGNTTRTVLATIRPNGYSNYAYFDNVDTRDPASGETLSQLNGESGGFVANLSGVCLDYRWANKTVYDASPCAVTGAAFTSKYNIVGPVQVNDSMWGYGSPALRGYVTTADPGSPNFGTYAAGTYTPAYGDLRNSTAGSPTTAPAIAQLSSVSALKTLAQTSGASSANSGCLYTGPTRITFNSDGTENIYSPFTKDTNVSAPGSAGSTTGSAPSACGAVSGTTNSLQASGGAKVSLNKNLIFVQNVPNLPSDVNYTAPVSSSGNGTYSNGLTCSNSGTVLEGWSGGGYGWPVTKSGVTEQPALETTTGTNYGCRNGDVYAEGAVSGQQSVVAEKNIYITNSITYSSAASLLGLVAQNQVLIWTPVTSGGSGVSGEQLMAGLASNITIDASILAVTGSFGSSAGISNTLGSINVFGSVAENFRGHDFSISVMAVTILSDYSSFNSTWDQKLKMVNPPFWPQPPTTAYQVAQYAAVGAVFNSDGSRR